MRTAIMFSGGWDSAAAAIKTMNKTIDFDLIFFAYNQSYLGNELKAAIKFANYFNLNLRIIKLDLVHDQPRRNFHFIAELHRRGYRRIVSGSRNLAPPFDRYRDSNFISLKLLGLLFGVSIEMPVVGQSKRRIIDITRQKYPYAMYNCYLNSTELSTCPCVNCVEIKHIMCQ